MTDPANLILARIGECEVFVEVVDVGGVSEVGLRDALSTEAVWATLEEVTQAIQSVWCKVRPSEAEVEFGLACALKAGKLQAYLVGGSVSSNLKVKLKWTDQPAATSPQD